MGETERAARVAEIAVEVAVDGLSGALAAAAGGAHRLELCSALAEGGLTPSAGLCDAVTNAVDIPVLAMLRPRGGDFLYDDGEFDVVLRDVEHLRRAGAAGFVCGALLPDGDIDRVRVRALVAAASPLPITFHRAFDLCREPFAALHELAALGVRRILTSGQSPSAPAGAAKLRELVALAPAGLTIVAGAGVRSGNAATLVRSTGVREVHLSATEWQPSPMVFRRAGVPMGSPPPIDEYMRRTTSATEVAAVVAALAAAGPRPDEPGRAG